MSKLMDELRRRHVFKVAIAYLVAGWLVLQVTDVVAGVIGLPDWTLKLVGFLFALGLPVVLLFSWIFEITPEGLKREKDLAADDAARQHSGRRLNLAIALLMVISVPLITVQVIARGGIGALILPDSAPEIQSRVDASGLALPDYDSVAVLPFVNMSSDPEQEYFSDGISEEILNVLARVPELSVAARTSSFQFKGEKRDVAQIAAQLKVRMVLEGSVRRIGNKLRITTQLIKVADGYHLWSETYDRDMTDLLAIQAEVSQQVVKALPLACTG